MRGRYLCCVCLPILLWCLLTGMLSESEPRFEPFPEGTPVILDGTVTWIEPGSQGQKIYLKNISNISSNSNNSNISEEHSLSDHTRQIQKQVLAYVKEIQELKIGNRVRLSGVCAYPEKPRNPGGFDGVSYYGAKQIQLLLKKAQLKENDGRTEVLRQTLYAVRKRMENTLDACLEPVNAGVMRAMLAGDRSALEEDVKSAYQDSGMIHILAISGLHISLLGMQLYGILRRGGAGQLAGGAVSCAMLILYGMLTGGAVSAMRATLMFILSMGARIRGRTYDAPTAIVVSATLLLLQNPRQGTQAGFWLSFGAVTGVLAASQMLRSWEKTKQRKIRNSFPSELLRGQKQALIISMGTWVTTLPLCAYFYYQVPVCGILLNLLILPLMPVILGCGLIGILAGSLSIELGRFVMAPVHYLLKGIVLLCEKARLLPCAVIVTGRPALSKLLGYYIGLLIVVFFWKRRKRLTGLIMGMALVLLMLFGRAPQPWSMTFLDVGQGDGCCIRSGHGKVWMVDGGSSREGLAKNCLIPYLKSQGIRRVEVWFLSHFDTDHISGLMELLQSYEKNLLGENAAGITVGMIVIPGGSPDKEEKTQLLKLAAECGIIVREVQAGDVIRQGETEARILSPMAGKRYEESNAGSMVMEISYKEFRVLMTGDLEGVGETELLEFKEITDVDVLKAAHHGSRYATSEAFLQQAKPELTVISCARQNRYGHPHEELLERVRACGSRIVRTDRNGAIRITVKTDGYTVEAAES